MTKQAKANIVIVDDDPDITEFVQRTVEATGYRAICAADGRECLDILEDTDAVCIISDIVMPEMDGVELFNRLSQRFQKIPLVLISGYQGRYLDNATMLASARGLMVLGALEKGFSAGDLIEVLSNLEA